MCHHGDKHGRSRACEAEFLRAHFRSSTSVLAGPHRLQHQQQQWNQFLGVLLLARRGLALCIALCLCLGLRVLRLLQRIPGREACKDLASYWEIASSFISAARKRSLNRGTQSRPQNTELKSNNPLYRDPQNGTPSFGKPPCQQWDEVRLLLHWWIIRFVMEAGRHGSFHCRDDKQTNRPGRKTDSTRGRRKIQSQE